MMVGTDETLRGSGFIGCGVDVGWICDAARRWIRVQVRVVFGVGDNCDDKGRMGGGIDEGRGDARGASARLSVYERPWQRR